MSDNVKYQKPPKPPKSRLAKATKYTGKPMDTIIIIVVVVLGYIAAFAWRDAAKEAFERYYPEDANGDSLKPRVIYATIATVVAIIAIMILARIK